MQIETPPVDKPYDKPEGERRGLIIVNTGDGKGKSTAAFGLALRAQGRHHVHGKRVKIFQFMKVPSARIGEHRMFEKMGIPMPISSVPARPLMTSIAASIRASIATSTATSIATSIWIFQACAATASNCATRPALACLAMCAWACCRPRHRMHWPLD